MDQSADTITFSYQQIAQMDAFVQSIRTKTKPKASGEEGWKDMKLIGSILQAAETGRKIQIDWQS